MTAAFRYEWRRLWTIRSTYWLIGSTLGFQFIMSFIIAASIDPLSTVLSDGQITSSVVSVGASIGNVPLFSAYIIAMLGVFSFGHEYRHGMIRSTLTAVPSRGAVLTAKIVTTALLAAVLAFVCALIGLLNASLFLGGDVAVNTSFVWKVILGLVAYTVLFGLGGLGLAGLLRNQTGALALVLLFPSVIEGALHILLIIPEGEDGINKVASFLPFDAGGQMFARPLFSDVLDIFGYVPLEPVEGGLVFGVFIAVVVALTGALFIQRDA
jgi:ABC-type transport system involved in multi-copper enzyme maturation permease subunit